MASTLVSDRLPIQYIDERKKMTTHQRKVMTYIYNNRNARIDEVATECDTTPSDVQQIIGECREYYGVSL